MSARREEGSRGSWFEICNAQQELKKRYGVHSNHESRTTGHKSRVAKHDSRTRQFPPARTRAAHRRGDDPALLQPPARDVRPSLRGVRGSPGLCPAPVGAVPVSREQADVRKMPDPLLPAGATRADPGRHALRRSPDALAASASRDTASVGWDEEGGGEEVGRGAPYGLRGVFPSTAWHLSYVRTCVWFPPAARVTGKSSPNRPPWPRTPADTRSS